jgi:predicted DNA binding CopG/RHH family protein
MIELNQEEQSLLDSVESGQWQSKPDLAQRKLFLQQCTQQQLAEQTAHLDIALSKRDFEMLKSFAVKDCVNNYQTFAKGIVHRYLQERLDMAG